MINTASGAKLFIGGTTAIVGANAAAKITAFEAIVWTEVGELEDLGEFGDESERVTFTGLSDGRVRKLKGPRDAGEQTVVVADDMLDTGQIAMEAAEASPLDYNFKVQLNDAITIGGDDSAHYFRGKVFSKRRNVGNASNVVRRNFVIGINTEILSTDPN
jgi:hypothetical protein